MCVRSPWHDMQRCARMGWISRANSTLVGDAAGSIWLVSNNAKDNLMINVVRLRTNYIKCRLRRLTCIRIYNKWLWCGFDKKVDPETNLSFELRGQWCFFQPDMHCANSMPR
jgi:hypothetical protein